MLTIAQLEELRRFDSPTVCNALERFQLRPRSQGFLPPEIRSIFNHGRPFVGYASTAKFSTAAPAEKPLSMEGYYRHVQDAPRPSISVIQDIDPVSVGALWGEVNVNIHMALGAVATVTNGGVRDCTEVEPLGFGYFARNVMVSHAYIHLVEYGCPVDIMGVTITPGDLLFCDGQGIVAIPHEAAPFLAAECRAVASAELPVLEGVRRARLAGKEVDVAELMGWMAQMQALRTK